MPGAGMVVVKNHYSVMSPGTDKLAMSFAQKSILGKARSRPDLVKQVVTKLRQEGPVATYRTVTSRLDAPQPLGYSSAGIVCIVGPGVTEFAVGDRVACAGAGYANHAELVAVPINLVARVPANVDLEQAAYTTLGAIALQGVRVTAPTLGEIAAVIGLGLVGQLTVQLLRANGCRVLGLDLDPRRVEQSLAQGAEWAYSPQDFNETWLMNETDGIGVDLALVTAASESSAPLKMAAELSRKKGRIGFIGAMPIELDRRVMLEKELDLRMSMSYGPGRYDRRYEEQGMDYPVSYVRWTENRNLQAFLGLLSSNSIDMSSLDTELRPFEDAVVSYEARNAGRASSLAVVFRYAEQFDPSQNLVFESNVRPIRPEEIGVAFIGAGNYAKAVLLPMLKNVKAVDKLTLVTATGSSARRSAAVFGFRGCSTEPEAVFKDPNVDFVFVTTRHDTHVGYAIEAIRNSKGVWLEKPASLDLEGLRNLIQELQEKRGFLAIGYNRRFSSHTLRIQQFFENRDGPMMIHYRVVAPSPGLESWVMDPSEGGGRIVGEACHFVDLCNQLTGQLAHEVYARSLTTNAVDDTFTTTLRYEDGSIATIDYLANAAEELSKEYFEVSADGRTARCDNFRRTRLSGRKSFKTFNQDKGQQAAIAAVLGAFRGQEGSPFSVNEIANVSLVTFAICQSIASGRPVEVFTDRIDTEPAQHEFS